MNALEKVSHTQIFAVELSSLDVLFSLFQFMRELEKNDGK